MAKYVIQKETGLGETTVVELDLRSTDPVAENEARVRGAYKLMDERLWQTNAKIVEVREFVDQIKDPNYRYLFVSFFDTLMGISSQAESLQKKFKVDPPMHFDEWLQKRERLLEPVKK